MPDGLPNELPDGLPNELPDGLPNELPYGLPNELPDGLPNELPDGLPNELPKMLLLQRCCIAKSAVLHKLLHPRIRCIRCAGSGSEFEK